MNNIYDFNEIEKIRERQRRLTVSYILYALCFAFALLLACLLVKSSVLLTAVFALLLLFFILFSIVFWKIKYGILNEYRTFLDNMETGSREDYVGVLEKKETSADDGDPFDKYTFVSASKERSFFVRSQQRVGFTEGKKYHIEHVGSYICRWEIIE